MKSDNALLPHPSTVLDKIRVPTSPRTKSIEARRPEHLAESSSDSGLDLDQNNLFKQLTRAKNHKKHPLDESHESQEKLRKREEKSALKTASASNKALLSGEQPATPNI